jgi:hypothetical protein
MLVLQHKINKDYQTEVLLWRSSCIYLHLAYDNFHLPCEGKIDLFRSYIQVERVTNKMVEDKKEYDLRLQEYAQLLDIRAERIKVICY